MKNNFMKKSVMFFVLLLLQCTIAFAQTAVKHVVQRGETIQSIAEKYGVSEESIKAANPSAAKFVYVGMELTIEKSVETKPLQSSIPAISTANSEVQTVTDLIDPDEPLKSLSGSIEYLGIEHGWGAGINIMSNYVTLSSEALYGETNKYVDTNEAWGISLGAHDRYWIVDEKLFIEGCAGFFYRHSTFKLKGDDKKKDDTVGLYVTPRIGYALGRWYESGAVGRCAIVAGYRWDFNDCKLKKDYMNDYFTVGLSIIFRVC